MIGLPFPLVQVLRFPDKPGMTLIYLKMSGTNSLR